MAFIWGLEPWSWYWWYDGTFVANQTLLWLNPLCLIVIPLVRMARKYVREHSLDKE